MTNKKLTDRSEKTSGFADDDLQHVVDVSNTSQSPKGSSFKSKLLNLWKYFVSKIIGRDSTYNSTTGEFTIHNFTSIERHVDQSGNVSIALDASASVDHFVYIDGATTFTGLVITSYASPKDGAKVKILVNKGVQGAINILSVIIGGSGSDIGARVWELVYSTSLASWIPVRTSDLGLTTLQVAYDNGNTVNGTIVIIDSTGSINWFAVGTDALTGASGTNLNATGQNAGRKNTGSYNNFRGLSAGYDPTGDNGQSGDYCNFDGFRAGDQNTGDEVNGIGPLAAHLNTANRVNASGSQAARQNSGTRVNARGYRAAYLNTANDVNADGENAANQNTGSAVNALGNSACASQTGTNVNAMGDEAAKENTGSDVNAFGSDAGNANTGQRLNAFGDSAGRENEGDDCTFIGKNAGYNPSAAAGDRGNKIDSMFGIANASLPSYADHATAAAAITVALGAPANTSYLYHNQSTDAIGVVRL